MNRLMTTVGVLGLCAAVSVRAQTTDKGAAAVKADAKPPATVAADKGGLKLDGGMDFRFRDEMKNHLPGTGVTAKKFENMVRLRSRMWASASYEDFTLYGRLANEFRYYTARTGKNRVPFASSKTGSSTYAFPDEAYIDNLYFEARNLLWDRLDLRAGRQDMKLGSGRIIADGSAGDGARSAYFDAVRGTYHVTDKTTLDAFGLYMDDYDPLAIGPYDRSLETYKDYGDNEEAGAGFYLTVNEIKEFPFEIYYVWENQTHTHNVGTTPYGRDFHTIGTRLLPKFTDQLSGEIEVAGQTGETDDGRDIFGYMAYGGLTYALAPDTSYKPFITPAVLYLSGDDNANAGDDNNWNPVFNRTTWFSVLLADQYKNYTWANLIYPHLEGGVTIFGNQKVKVHTGPVFAVEDDQGTKNGAGDQTYKGYLTYIRYEASLIKGFLGKRSDLNHAVQIEGFQPGDYYETDDYATFVRYELNLKF